MCARQVVTIQNLCHTNELFCALSILHRFFEIFNTFMSVGFWDFHAKTTGLHMALRKHNSDVERGRELFKGSKDSVSSSLHSKNFFLVGDADFS